MQNEIVDEVSVEVPGSDELMSTLLEMVACAKSNSSDPVAMLAVAWD